MKRGSKAPWKITVQFEDDKPFRRANETRSAALHQAGVSLRAAKHRDLNCTVKMWRDADDTHPGTDFVRLVLDDNEDVVPA